MSLLIEIVKYLRKIQMVFDDLGILYYIQLWYLLKKGIRQLR